MSILYTILVTLVALEFFYIFYLETLATTSETTGRVFQMSQEELQRSSVQTLFKNQGVYNGLLGVLLLIALYVLGNHVFVNLLLGYIVLVAAYGSVTSSKSILLKQGGLPIVALILAIFM